ncbi:sensor histidine kinase [Azospirillum sp. sgz301742]
MWRDLFRRGVERAVAQFPSAVATAPFPAVDGDWAVALFRGRALAALACTPMGDGGEDAAALRARIAELEAELGRTELLLRETNHRAKNAFATIASLVAIELADIRDPQAREVLQLTQERLAAVALVHQALQGKSDDAVLDLGALLHRLGTATAFSMGADERGIEVRIAAQAVPVEANQAVSLALVANELLTNALKYAFAGRTEGVVELALRKRAGKLLLRVRDNGVGVAGGRRSSAGTGLSLVRRLAEQVGARLRFGGRDGTSVTVSIPYGPG